MSFSKGGDSVDERKWGNTPKLNKEKEGGRYFKNEPFWLSCMYSMAHLQIQSSSQSTEEKVYSP